MIAWRSQLLLEDHVTAGFSCGHESLDRWLTDSALRAQQSGTARIYVWTDQNARDVVAYFSLAPTQVMRETVPRSISGGVSVVPGYLIARLGIDRALQGRGLGSELLLDALSRIVAAADEVAGRVIVVDAIDERAATFYEHHDFRRTADASRLVLKVATARAAMTG